MKFRTELFIDESKDKISYADKLFTIGSCFSEEIGQKLVHHGFQVQSNPFGTVFNPISIAKLLQHTIQNSQIKADEVHREGNRYFHFDFHSSFNHDNAADVASHINENIKSSHDALKTTQCLIITLGTCFVYHLASSGELVSNCHKVPNHYFTKKLLDESFMFDALCNLIEEIHAFNPMLNIIMTVSPVRHIKDGIVNNNRSKSLLIGVVHRLVDKYSGIHYFPAYELMMDDLRDYRFYKEDMIHPSEQAVSYIWKKFCDVYMDENTQKLALDFHKARKKEMHIKQKSR